MTSPWKGEERVWEESIAAQLRDGGFEVHVEPERAQLPFDLGSYRPDLIATRDDGGLIVEIKRREQRLSIDRYVEVAALVRRHPGWRFLLIPTDRLKETGLAALLVLPSRSELIQRQNAAAMLLESRLYVPAFLTAWAGVESYLRLLAEEFAVPIGSLSPVALVKHLYSHGLLSVEQFNLLQALLPVRNRVVHGLDDPSLPESAPRVVGLLASLLSVDSTSPPAV